jgi:hypothetical protein
MTIHRSFLEGGRNGMLSLEQKKAIFSLFELEEKKMSNRRIDYDYPASTQRGKKIATQLYKSGNGYVIGKYMSKEAIHANNYEVDPRGWINIMNFSSEELKQVIIEAMISMSSTEEYLTFEDSSPIEKQIISTQISGDPLTKSEGHPYIENYFRIINGQLKFLCEVQSFTLITRSNFAKGVLSVWEEYYKVKVSR